MRWRGVPAFLLAIAAGFNFANTGAVATRLSAEYGVALATVGLFTTALFVAHATTQLPAGRAIDRFGARRLASSGALVIAGCNALAMVASEPALSDRRRGAASAPRVLPAAASPAAGIVVTSPRGRGRHAAVGSQPSG